MDDETYPVVGKPFAEKLNPDGTSTVGRGGGNIDLDRALVCRVDDVVVAVIVGPCKK